MSEIAWLRQQGFSAGPHRTGANINRGPRKRSTIMMTWESCSFGWALYRTELRNQSPPHDQRPLQLHESQTKLKPIQRHLRSPRVFSCRREISAPSAQN